jgi:hypothetical protein
VKDIVEHIVPFEEVSFAAEKEIKEKLIGFVEDLKQKMDSFNFDACFTKFCLSTVPASLAQTIIVKKKKLRGCRGGKSSKASLNGKKKKAERPPLTTTSSSSQVNSRSSTEVTEKFTVPVHTVGKIIVNTLLKNVKLDQQHKFQSQEDASPDTSFEKEGTAQNLIKTKKKEKNKMKKALLKKKQKNLFQLSQSSSQDSLSRYNNSNNQHISVLATNSSVLPIPQQQDSGQMHHLKRKFHTLHESSSSSLCETLAKEIDLLDPVSKGVASSSFPSLPEVTQNICDLSTKVNDTSEYVKSVCRHLFPLTTFWGNRHNYNKFMSKIDDYLMIGRIESFTMEQIMHGIQLSELPWIQYYRETVLNKKCEDEFANEGNQSECPKKKRKHHQSIQLDQECNHLAYSLIYWIFVNIINFLISNAFYVTEIEGKGSQVFYFQKKVWNEIVQKNMKSFHHHFVPILLSDEYLAEQETEMKNLLSSSTSNPSNLLSNRRPSSMTTVLPSNSINEPSTIVQSSSFPLKRARSNPLPLPGRGEGTAVITGHGTTEIPRSKSDCRVVFHDLPPLPQDQQKEQQQQQKGLLPATTKSKSLLFNDWIKKNSSKLPDTSGTLNALLLNSLPKELPSNKVSSTATITSTYSFNRPQPTKTIKTTTTTKSPKLQNFLLQIPPVRFVPKKGTIRPITNLRSKNHFKKGSMSNNNPALEILSNKNLYNCFHVLKGIYDHKTTTNLKGFSVFGLDEIYQKICSYKLSVFKKYEQINLNQDSKKIPKFYMMTLDLEKCYDNIQTPLLYDIMRFILASFPGGSSSSSSICSSQLSSSTNPLNAFPYERYFPLEKYYNLPNNGVGKECSTTITTPSSSPAAADSTAFLEEESLIHRYTLLYTINSMKRIIIKPIKYVSFENEILSFQEVGKEIAQNYPSSIIQDNVIFAKLTRKEILRLLKIHLFSHIVKMPTNHCFSLPTKKKQTTAIPNKSNPNPGSSSLQNSHYNIPTQYFTQITGIPQGSMLSPLFCNLYYGFLENLFFHLSSKNGENSCSENNLNADPFGLKSQETLITRLMDDYLIISTDLNHLKNVYQTIKEEFQSFGGIINQTKIQTNFSFDLLSSNKVPVDQPINDAVIPEFINYCGLKIHSQSLFVAPHFDKLLTAPSSSSSPSSSCLWHSVNINYQQITFGLQKSIKQFFRIKCHSIFLDNQMNSHPDYSPQEQRQFIVANVYSLFLFTSMRSFLYYTKLQKYYFRFLIKENYFFASIKEFISFAFSLIQIRSNHKISRKLSLDRKDEDDDEDDSDDEEVENDEQDEKKEVQVNVKNFGQCPLTKQEVENLIF